MLIVTLFVAAWITCGVITAGYAHGYFCNKYPYFNHKSIYLFNIFIGVLTGPLSTISVGFACGFKHYRFFFQDKEEAWAAFDKKFFGLGRDYFEADWKRRI